MTVYTVTACNKFFWQALAVDAANESDAAEKFTGYLEEPQQQCDEQYEYEAQCNIQGSHEDFDDDAPDRNDYRYQFDADDIEVDDAVKATAEVRMIESGGNG